MEETKTCSDCGRTLPISMFNKHVSGVTLKMCKECQSKRRSIGQQKRYYSVASKTCGHKYSDPDFDGKTPREVQDILARAAKWLNNYGGFTCDVSLRYEKTINLDVR